MAALTRRVLPAGTLRVAARAMSTKKNAGTKKASKGEAKNAPEVAKQPFPEPFLNYGTLRMEDREYYKEEEEEDRSVRKERADVFPVILRPEMTLGFHGRDQHESLTSARGYSDQELQQLTDMHRIRMTDFFHLTLPNIEEHTDILRPYCKPFQAPPADKTVRFVTRYIYDGNRKAHPLSYKATLKVAVKTLGLKPAARERLLAMVGPRYTPETDDLVLNSQRFPTTAANRLYITRQLQALVAEAKKEPTPEQVKA